MKKHLLLRCLGSLALLLSLTAHADQFPAEPIKIVVPYATGGIADVLARLVGARLEPLVKQPVIVENRSGGNGTIAMQFVAQAKPDGYTLLLGNTGTQVVNRYLYKNLPFDIVRGFQPIGKIAQTPMMLVVSAASPANTVAELITMAQASKTPLNVGSSGNGSASHLGLVMLSSMAKIGSRERQPALPDVPTIAETVPGFELTTWLGLFAPTGLATDRLTRLNEALRQVLEEPSFRKQLVDQGNEVLPSTPSEFATFIELEAARIGALVQSADIRPE